MMKRILIIEDEESIAELEKDYLELSGFEVEIENDGESGLSRALREEYDLFILDLMLPGLSGEEVLPHLAGVPVIVLSAKADVEDKVELLLGGAADYLTRSGALALGLMIISPSPSAPARWWPGSRLIWPDMSGLSEAACRTMRSWRSGG